MFLKAYKHHLILCMQLRRFLDNQLSWNEVLVGLTRQPVLCKIPMENIFRSDIDVNRINNLVR